MLEGIIRESISKADAKALRNDGYLIANIYGKGQANIHCAFKVNDFIREMKSKTSLVFALKVGGKSYDVVIQEYQRDPIHNTILHVDFLLAQKGIKAVYKVPVKTIGSAKGLKNRGILLVSTKRISVKCDAADLPNDYTIDVSDLDVGDSILVRDLPAKPNIVVLNNPSVAVVGIITSK